MSDSIPSGVTKHDSDPTTTAVSEASTSDSVASVLRPSVLHVCTSCRAPGSPREPREHRAGNQLYRELQSKISESPLGRYVEVRPAECLSVCPRPCGIALSSPGAWSYIFGEQQVGKTADEIMACASLYIGISNGFMPRKERPPALRASILGRVPPWEDRR